MYSLLFEIIHNNVWRCITCSNDTIVRYCIGDSNNHKHWRCNTCIVNIDIDYTKINIYMEAVTSYDNSYYMYYDRDMIKYLSYNSIFMGPNIFRLALNAFMLTKI